MDYHNDRFQDASLMIYNGEQLIACIPGNQVNRQFYSHQGLTYGGFIFIKHINDELLESVLHKTVAYLQQHYLRIEWRWQPEIYNPIHYKVLKIIEEKGFKNYQALHNLHVSLKEDITISSKKTVGYRNGKFDEMKLVVNNDFKTFWDQVLEPQLKARHDAKPVHSLAEIELLGSRFPNAIKQYLVYENEEPLAGVTFFVKGTIVKSQYAAATIQGMKKSALDFLYLEATQDFKDQGMDYIDYGHVNNPDGSINRGLQRFKEELGAVNQPVYRSQWTQL